MGVNGTPSINFEARVEQGRYLGFLHFGEKRSGD